MLGGMWDLSSQAGSNWHSLHWKQSLITRPPGKSFFFFFPILEVSFSVQYTNIVQSSKVTEESTMKSQSLLSFLTSGYTLLPAPEADLPEGQRWLWAPKLPMRLAGDGEGRTRGRKEGMTNPQYLFLQSPPTLCLSLHGSLCGFQKLSSHFSFCRRAANGFLPLLTLRFCTFVNSRFIKWSSKYLLCMCLQFPAGILKDTVSSKLCS